MVGVNALRYRFMGQCGVSELYSKASVHASARLMTLYTVIVCNIPHGSHFLRPAQAAAKKAKLAAKKFCEANSGKNAEPQPCHK
jgi:hypothetical protein